MMRRVLSLPILMLLLAALPAWPQGTLPPSFAGWRSLQSAPFDPAHMAHIDDPAAAAAPREYGFVSGESTWYSHGLANLNVQAYRMKDASGAYGLYSYLRTPAMRRATFTEHS